ncbi:hypothetical protein [Spirillospora sp. NPDC048819]|uniref:hypothetical protein n=1 Tax=Spirillospora sp. NPDC048819 TaxID=3155268 RepID=UPI0033DAC2EE
MYDDPILPDDVTGEELDEEARAELRTLPKELAAKVARHLVMAGRLAEEEPERAYKHARAARRLASRVGVVREAAGIAAYHAGEWSEALAELRAARRLSAGDESYLPVMADCERGLGRPERALDLIKSPEAKNLDQMGLVELRIVESGVRRDLGQHDAAVVTLQIPELRDRRLRPWSMRLFYAYADALVEAGREDEASDWFARAAAADRDGDTDAAERYAELEGLHIVDTEVGEIEGVIAGEGAVPEGVGLEGAVTQDAGPDAGLPEAVAPEAVAPEGTTREADVPEAGASEAGASEAGVSEGDGSQDFMGEDGASEGAGPRGAGAEDAGAVEGVARDGAAGAEVGAEDVSATDFEFKAAGPEEPEVPGEGAPEVPVVFLEPEPAEEEQPPPAE